MARVEVIALSLCVAAAPLAGCAAGRSFSLAMADPGPVRTVLVVGDGGQAGVPVAAAAPGGSGAAPPSALVGALTVSPVRTASAPGATARLALPSSASVTLAPLASAQLGLGSGLSGGVSVALAGATPLPVTASLGAGGVSVGVANLVGAGVTRADGLSLVVTNTGAANLGATLAGVTGPGVSGVVGAALAAASPSAALAAPVPGLVTPTVKALGTLPVAIGRKPRRG